MDDLINKINDIGIDEISKKTFINQQFLKAIVEKDFSQFTPNRVKKCSHILKRDYDLDMQEWVDEFNNYLKSNNLDANNDDIQTNIIEEKQEKSYKAIYILSLLLLLGILSYFAFDAFKQSDFYNKSEVKQSSYEEHENLAQDIYQASNEALQNEDKIEENSQENLQENEQNIQEQNEEIAQAVQENETKNNYAKIEVSKLWIAEYNLDTKEKKESIYSGEYNIDLNKNYTFLTGHGSFVLDIDGKKVKLTKSGNVSFLVKDGKIEEISKDEYNNLIKGNRA